MDYIVIEDYHNGEWVLIKNDIGEKLDKEVVLTIKDIVYCGIITIGFYVGMYIGYVLRG